MLLCQQSLRCEVRTLVITVTNAGFKVLTGFNTDVEHGGITYHVQTEDKGLTTPLILSLVYHGGAILVARRTPYEDLIKQGFDEAVLAERLHRQHKLICAAIKAGRLKDLQTKSATPTKIETVVPHINSAPPIPEALLPDNILELPVIRFTLVEDAELNLASATKQIERVSSRSAPVISNAVPNAVSPPARLVKHGVADFASVASDERTPRLVLRHEPDLRAGTTVKLELEVSETPHANLKIKLIGTAFRPQQIELHTDADGRASCDLALPNFTEGRAVLLIAATVGEYQLELRRIIQAA